VLIFDLKPHLRKNPRPLPRRLGRFLTDSSRTFLGLGLQSPAGHLAFEFDAVVRCVDYRVRALRQMSIEGGFFGLARTYFGTQWRKRPSLRTVDGQAVATYLQWAVAEYFMAFYGERQESWVISKAELFAHGPRAMRVEKPQNEWDDARQEWVRLREERSEEQLRKAKDFQWYLNPRNLSLQDREQSVMK